MCSFFYFSTCQSPKAYNLHPTKKWCQEKVNISEMSETEARPKSSRKWSTPKRDWRCIMQCFSQFKTASRTLLDERGMLLSKYPKNHLRYIYRILFPHPISAPHFRSCVCVLPFFSGQVKVCVDIQQDLFKEAQPLALSFLGEVKHLLHVLHVAGVAAVQLVQGLFITLFGLQNTQPLLRNIELQYCTY